MDLIFKIIIKIVLTEVNERAINSEAVLITTCGNDTCKVKVRVELRKEVRVIKGDVIEEP